MHRTISKHINKTYSARKITRANSRWLERKWEQFCLCERNCIGVQHEDVPHNTSTLISSSTLDSRQALELSDSLWPLEKTFCNYDKRKWIFVNNSTSMLCSACYTSTRHVHNNTSTSETFNSNECSSSSSSSSSTPKSYAEKNEKSVWSLSTELEEKPHRITIVDARRKRHSSSSEAHMELDEEGLVIRFSQGPREYCWRPLHVANTNIKSKTPVLVKGDTIYKNMLMFGMPKGYPDTTAEGYKRFFFLSQSSAFVSNFSSSIGYQSLLNGFFLGASPQMWMLKDLVPALIATFMANRVVSYENRPKFWFCVSVFMNNATVMTDMLIPSFFPHHLLIAAIATSTIKQSSALMYFVARASALQHFSINNNLAELTKKFNSFGMVNYTLASAMGIVYCTYIASFPVQVITALVCCALNMILAPMSMNEIAFRILNFTTASLVFRAFITRQVILTPEQVAEHLGVRMKLHFDKDHEDMERLLCISPPISKMYIRTDRLERDVLYVCHRRTFMLALWRPLRVPLTFRESWDRNQTPHFLTNITHQYRKTCEWISKKKNNVKWFRTNAEITKVFKADKVFDGRKLVLLVHTSCTPHDLMTAYLIMYTAVLQHSDSENELREFIRECNNNQRVWEEKATLLRERLRDEYWDVELPAMDHPNARLSHLIIPKSMQNRESQHQQHEEQQQQHREEWCKKSTKEREGNEGKT